MGILYSKNEEKVEVKTEIIQTPSDDIFVTYLNNLWNNNNNNDEKEIKNVRILNELPNNSEVSDEEIKKFKELIETNLATFKILDKVAYSDKIEKEVRLKKDELGINDLKIAYLVIKDLENHNQVNNELMNKINKVQVSSKIKDINKDKLNPKNYRFIQSHSKCIKLIDRLWCIKILEKINSLDKNIFKSSLIKDFNTTVVQTASNNTLTFENVVLIDIEKAFDSCDYQVVEELLLRSLKKKMEESLAISTTNQYMYIVKQRILYFKDKLIDFHKGIPTGLPSSNIIFSLIMDEIIQEWFISNKDNFKLDEDFLLNIFVDDIYLKLKEKGLINKDLIIKSLIDILSKYKFKVNLNKCKADKNLKIEGFCDLEESDFYLGIPFTRDIRKYSNIILKQYNDINKTNETYNILYLKIIDKHEDAKKILGFFNYKFKPIMNDLDFITFIETYLI